MKPNKAKSDKIQEKDAESRVDTTLSISISSFVVLTFILLFTGGMGMPPEELGVVKPYAMYYLQSAEDKMYAVMSIPDLPADTFELKKAEEESQKAHIEYTKAWSFLNEGNYAPAVDSFNKSLAHSKEVIRLVDIILNKNSTKKEVNTKYSEQVKEDDPRKTIKLERTKETGFETIYIFSITANETMDDTLVVKAKDNDVVIKDYESPIHLEANNPEFIEVRIPLNDPDGNPIEVTDMIVKTLDPEEVVFSFTDDEASSETGSVGDSEKKDVLTIGDQTVDTKNAKKYDRTEWWMNQYAYGDCEDGCDDSNPCTIDSCNQATGECVHTPKDCDDGDPCTIDSCNQATGECVHTPKDCDDGDPCTPDTCNKITGECVHDKAAEQDGRCSVPGGEILDMDPFLRNCCRMHDNCYTQNACTSASWTHWCGWRCTLCNIEVVACFAIRGATFPLIGGGLLSTGGFISPENSNSHSTQIDSTVSKATFSTYWSGSDLDMTLYTPSGRKIDPTIAASDPNITFINGTTYESYICQNPEHGNWTVNVTAVDVPAEGENYTVWVSLDTNLTLSLSTDKYQYYQDESINITATLTNNSTPLTGADVVVRIEKPDGTSENLTLYDDGTPIDAVSDDGNYTNIYQNTSATGFYNIIAFANGTIDGEQFERQAFGFVSVIQYPDLKVTDLSYYPPIPNVGENITINAAISNVGLDINLDKINISFYLDNNFKYSKVLNLTEIYEKHVNFTWVAEVGNHTITIKVDPDNLINESDETNNQLSVMIRVCMKGDIDCDCDIDLLDFVRFARMYETTCGDQGYNPLADFDSDCDIDFLDFVGFARKYETTCVCCD